MQQVFDMTFHHIIS